MKRLALLLSLLLAGCATVPPAPSPRAYLASLTKDASPIRRERKVGERSILLAAYGADLLPPSIQGELATVMKHRRAEGQWPALDELSAGGQRWHVSRLEDLLVLTLAADAQGPYPEIFVSPDGFIGLDAAHKQLFQIMDFANLARALLHPPRELPPNPIIVVPHRY